MRIIPYRIDRNGKIKQKTKEIKNLKPKELKTNPMHLWAVVTIQRVSLGIKRYIMILDPISRIAFAVAIPSKHTIYIATVLEALIDGLHMQNKSETFFILSYNSFRV